MKKVFLIVFIVGLILLQSFMVLAEGQKEGIGKPATTQEEYTIYFMSVAPGVDPFYATIYKGAEAANNCFPVNVKYVGLTAEELTATAMVDNLEIARAAKPDGIITGLWWLEAEDEVCRKIVEEGIPLIAFNTEDPKPKNDRIPYLSFVGMDERATGEILARATLDKTKIKRAAIGIHAPGASSLEMRANGIAKVLEAQNIPYDKLDVTMTPSTTITVLGAYIIKYPETNLLFLLGPGSTHAAMKLIEEQQLEGKVFISTVDVSEQILLGIKDGTILLTISQQPFAQSFLAVEQLYLYLEYGILPPDRTQTGPTIIDRTNLDVIKKQIQMTGGG